MMQEKMYRQNIVIGIFPIAGHLSVADMDGVI
jgi:hypothetical protein